MKKIPAHSLFKHQSGEVYFSIDPLPTSGIYIHFVDKHNDHIHGFLLSQINGHGVKFHFGIGKNFKEIDVSKPTRKLKIIGVDEI
jgi:hypothetical protein